MGKSLRWRLQVWNALILSLVIIAFGAAFYFQLRRTTLGEIDLELLSSARVLEGSLRSLPPRARGDGPPPNEPGMFPPRRPGENRIGERPGELPLGDRPPAPPSERPPGDRPGDYRFGPPRGQRGPNGPPFPTGDRLDNLLSIPGIPLRGPLDEPPYFAVFGPDGRLMRADPPNIEIEWTVPERPLQYRNVDSRREVQLRGPNATLIVVGRDIHRQIDRLSASLVQLITAGVAVLGLGLAGGWWMSGRAIQPIAQISATASQITASNLSQRIDTSTMDQELQALGGILNSMLLRLQDAFQQQSQFTADASHELRTPLAVILSHCELALNRPRSVEDFRQTIVTCQTAGLRMRTLVEDLLTLARADAGKLEIQNSAVDLHAIANDVAAMLAATATQRQVTLNVAGNPVHCSGDATRLSQVLTNLVSNAIHYNQTAGKVVITISQDGQEAVLSVRDTGCGIPAEAIPHLFDRFYRVDQARSRQSGDSGLGLAICKSIVDAHGGRLTVDSKLDEGSTFEVRLPALPVPGLEAELLAQFR